MLCQRLGSLLRPLGWLQRAGRLPCAWELGLHSPQPTGPVTAAWGACSQQGLLTQWRHPGGAGGGSSPPRSCGAVWGQGRLVTPAPGAWRPWERGLAGSAAPPPVRSPVLRGPSHAALLGVLAPVCPRGGLSRGPSARGGHTLPPSVLREGGRVLLLTGWLQTGISVVESGFPVSLAPAY